MDIPDPAALAAIEGVELFGILTHEDRVALARIATQRRLPPETSFIEEGETGASMFVVLLGQVRISKRSPHQGDEHIVTIGPGHYVGLNALVERESRRSASVSTGSEDALLYELNYDALDHLLTEEPAFAARFWRTAAKGLCRQLARVTTDTVVLRDLIRGQR